MMQPFQMPTFIFTNPTPNNRFLSILTSDFYSG